MWLLNTKIFEICSTNKQILLLPKNTHLHVIGMTHTYLEYLELIHHTYYHIKRIVNAMYKKKKKYTSFHFLHIHFCIYILLVFCFIMVNGYMIPKNLF